MKKALQVNINDKIYYINDDAYNLLHDYLNRLSATFTGPEGCEIVIDIESRIGELFDQHLQSGRNVIDIEYVNQVIDIVGQPEDLMDMEDEETKGRQQSQNQEEKNQETTKTVKKLYRNPRDKVFGGVLGGIACYFNWDPTILRILMVIVAVTTAFFPCIILYLIAWMVIPEANTPQRQLEMYGEPVTVDSIMKNIKDSLKSKGFSNHSSDKTPPPYYAPVDRSFRWWVTQCLTIGAKVLLGIIVAMGILFGCIAAIWLIGSLFLTVYGSIIGFSQMGLAMAFNSDFDPVQLVWMVGMGLIAIILCIGVIWATGCIGFGWKRPSNVTIGTLITLLIIAAVAVGLSAIYLNNLHIDNMVPF